MKKLSKYRLWLIGLMTIAVGVLLAFGKTEECKPILQALIGLIVGM
jgi:hypothetical protein